MKIAERAFFEDENLVIKKTFSADQALETAKAMRDSGLGFTGEHRCIGIIPEGMIEKWADEAGVSLSDPAMQQVIKRKMLSGEFDRLRVWGGNY